jgi:Glycosyltransferase family 87
MLAAAPAWSATEAQVKAGKAARPNVLPPPDPLQPLVFQPASQTVPPPTFAINARQAIAVGERTKAVRDARRKYKNLKATAYISPLQLPEGGFYHWDVYWRSGNKDIVEVEMGRSGHIFEIVKTIDIGWPLLYGSPGVLGHKLNAPYIWLPLCLLFLLPFLDPKRPFRLLHLDLAMLLLFGISQYFFALGKPGISVPLAYPFLLYALGRALFAAFRPRRRPGSLMPYVSTGFLIAGVVLFLGLRIWFNVADSGTFDVSTAGAIGADRIEHGQQLYVDNDVHGDTYGPVNYLMYVPFEELFPFKPPNHIAGAAKAATLSFDLLCVLGLFLLGRSLRPGRSGTRLGAGLAWAWTTFPYTSLVIASNTNDALVPLFVIYALLFMRSPPLRGLFGALATMAKFAPALVAPVIAVGRGPFRWRPVLTVTAVYVVVCGGLILAFLPAHGLKEFWNTTLGFQLSRTSPLSLWDRHPSLDWLKTIFSAFAVVLSVAAAFVPRRRTMGQIAALCAAILVAAQIPGAYWIYFYVIWFAPFLFVALFEEYGALGPGDQASVTSDFVKPEMISQPESVTATRSSMRTPSLPGR